MQTIVKNGIKTAVMLLLSIILGVVLMLCIYMLPVQEMKNNAHRSTELYNYEGVYPQLMQGYKMSQLDNCTDAIMILNAIFEGTGNLIDDAMTNYRVEYKDRTPVGSLTDYANDVVVGETYLASYSRYWHGYLVVLKPLMLFFDISDIRMINLVLQFSLLLGILWLMMKKNLEKYLICFIVPVILLNPLVTPLSFQFSTVTYIMLISSVIVLKKEDWKEEQVLYFFLLIGIATAFFDFLTFPLVGLYFPMIFMMMKQESWKKAVRIVVIGSIAWVIGYAGMWCGKWIVSGILTGRDVIGEALNRAGHYKEDAEVSVNSLQVILKNLMVLVKWPVVLGGLIVCIWIVKDFVKDRKKQILNFGWLMVFGMIAVVPFLWYIAAGTHSYEHYWFTYRELCVSIYAVLTCAYKCRETGKQNLNG